MVPTLEPRVQSTDLLINGASDQGEDITSTVRVAQGFFPKVKNQNRAILCGLLYQYGQLATEYLTAKNEYDEAQNDLVAMKLELVRATEMSKDKAEITELKNIIKSLSTVTEPKSTLVDLTVNQIVDLLNKQLVVSNKMDGTVYYERDEDYFDFKDRVLDHNTDVYITGTDKAQKSLAFVNKDEINDLLIGGLDYFVTQDTVPIASFSAYIQRCLMTVNVENISAIQDLLQYMDGNGYMALQLGTEAITESL